MSHPVRFPRFTIAALSMLLACGSDGGMGPSAPSLVDLPLEARVNGLTVTALVEIAPFGSPRTLVTVSVANDTDRSKTLDLAECDVVAVLYLESQPQAPAWNRLGLPVEHCFRPDGGITLGPGETASLEQGTSVSWMLGDTLPDGRYHIAAGVSVDGEEVILRGISTDFVRPHDALGLTGQLSSPTDNAQSIELETAVRNVSSDTTLVEFGACSLDVVASRPSDPSHLVWRYSHHLVPGGNRICPLYLGILSLAPEEAQTAREFQTSFSHGDVLGDSLPAGDYEFSASLNLNGMSTLLFSVGRVTLSGR